MRVGILSQVPSPIVQSGPAIHTRFLHDGLRKRGHDVTLMGPDMGVRGPTLDCSEHLFPGFSYPTHPDVKISMPGSPRRFFADNPKVDLIHGQAADHMLHYGLWAREMWQTAFINTNIVHLPSHSHFWLSDKLNANPAVSNWLKRRAEAMELSIARTIYNRGDCLIVQSRHFVKYWRDRGVTIPIEVVGRPINPAIFSSQPTEDPYPTHFKVGKRLVVVCRHDREKSLDRLIDLFANHIAPQDPEASLTLVGDGHHHTNLVMHAAKTDYADRIHFPGEAKHAALVNWYAHADLFVYTSLSETFGNVVNEALWSGLPCVCMDDKMGVSGQMVDGVNGALVDPDAADADVTFARATLRLLGDRELRRKLGEAGANLSRANAHPDVVLGRFEKIYDRALEHVRLNVPVPLSKRSKLAQVRGFARHYGTWSMMNGTLLGVAHATTRLGASRSGGANQHAEAAAVMAQAGRDAQAKQLQEALKTPQAQQRPARPAPRQTPISRASAPQPAA